MDTGLRFCWAACEHRGQPTINRAPTLASRGREWRTRERGRHTMTLKVGLFVGREWSWPPAFIEEVARRNEGVVAEFMEVGGTRMDEPVEYAVIIDRIS